MGQATGSRPGGAQQKPGVVQPGRVIQGKAAFMADAQHDCVHAQEPAELKAMHSRNRLPCLSA